MTESSGRHGWRLFLRVSAVLIALVAIAYFTREVVRYWPTIASISFTPAVAGALIAAALLQVFSGILDAWSWGWLLRGLSLTARTRDALGIFLVSQFAKYVPGNVMQHFSRVALARTRGWPVSAVLLSLVVENGFALGVGALFASAAIVFGLNEDTGGLARAGSTCAIVVFAWLAGAVTLRELLSKPPAWLSRLLALEKPVLLERKLVFGYLGSHVVSYASLGGALVLVVMGLGGGVSVELWRVAVAGIAGWFAGYIVPGAPAGFGVREATLTALLTPLYGPGPAVSAALLWRVSTLLGDGGLLLVGLGVRRRRYREAG